MGRIEDAKKWIRQQDAPVCVGIMGSFIVSTLVLWATAGPWEEYLIFVPSWLNRPWTVLTYPWAYMPLASSFGLLGFIFFLMWMVWLGMSVEREMGSRRFGVFMVAMVVIPALCAWIGSILFRVPLSLAGPWIPEAGLTVAWGARNPKAVIRLWGILPINGIILAAFTSAAILFSCGAGSPLLGVFLCVHLSLAWFFANDQLPIPFSARSAERAIAKDGSRSGVKYNQVYYEEVARREKERKEQERLRKLLGE